VNASNVDLFVCVIATRRYVHVNEYTFDVVVCVTAICRYMTARVYIIRHARAWFIKQHFH
jgi:hypothetical protein